LKAQKYLAHHFTIIPKQAAPVCWLDVGSDWTAPEHLNQFQVMVRYMPKPF